MNRIAGWRWCVSSLGMLLAASAQVHAAAGRIEGSGSVATTGSARYSIPLVLPPGTNGLAPTLAITYDSRNGNGLLGVGFHLAGLSKIHRCPNTLAQDGRISAVALDASDRYCLDGQRLRLTAGTYGAPGSQYQTEVETFARVTALGSAGAGPASFRVERRDGLIYEYGGTVDSRVESSLSTTPREWALNRVRDRDGNHFDVTYAEDSATGVHRPVFIAYSGNLNTGAAPYYLLQFTYEARPAQEMPYRFLAGGAVSDSMRLDRIDVLHISSGRTVRSYDLRYGAPGTTGRSRLESIEECAGGDCLEPTRFTWSSVSAGWLVDQSVALSTTQFATSIPADVDGDGFDDLVYQDGSSRLWMVLRGSPTGFQSQATGTGLGATSDGSQALAAELDGDGRSEILVPGSNGYLYRLRWATAGGYAFETTGVANAAPPGGLIATDVDGDGRDDLVYVKAGYDAIFWRRNQTDINSSYTAEAVLWSAPTGTRLMGAPFVEIQQRFRSIVRSGDFNGDGRTDLLVRAQQSIYCGKSCTNWVNRWLVLASDGSVLSQQYWFDGNTEALLGDFNGDALTDVAYWNPYGQWQLLLGSGARGSTLALFAGPFTTEAALPLAMGQAMVIDWDADGRSDLLQPGATGDLQYCRSAGTSLEACQPTGITPVASTSSPMTADINGDSHADLMFSTGSARLHLHQPMPPDMLVAVTDGLGSRSEFEYAPLTDAGVYRAVANATFPVRDYVGPGYVVSRMTAANGSLRETFFYEAAKVHMQGRGFLGFARRSVTPSDDAPLRVEEYLQDASVIEAVGLPWRVTLLQRSGATLQRTRYSWARHAYGSGYETRGFAYPASVTLDRYELDGTRFSTTVTSNTFDTFGTLLRQQSTTTELAKGLNPYAQHTETATLAGVVNDTSNWCLGRPVTTQVTRQHSLPGGAPVTRTVSHVWDYVRCREVQRVVEPSSTSLRVTTDTAYDSYGNVTAETVTPVGQSARTTTHTWGEQGRFLVSRTNAEGHVEHVGWDSVNALMSTVTDPNGLVTSLQYDGLGRVTRRTRPDGTATVTARAACGTSCVWPDAAYVVSVSERGVGDVLIGSIESGFDREGHEVYVRNELPGGAQSYRVRRYDSRGRLLKESIPGPCCASPSQWVTHGYDSLGRRTSVDRPTSQLEPGAAVTRWSYDGLSVAETDPLGRVTTSRFDAVGRVLQVTDPGFASSQYDYDAFGNLVRTRDASGAETAMAHDVRGFRRSISDPSAGGWSFDYLPTGELRSQTNARGQVTTFTYDRLSRPVKRVEPEGTTTWTWGKSASAHNIGARSAVSAPGFKETYVYDKYGRPTSVSRIVAGLTLQTRQSYDGVSGLPKVLTYPSPGGAAPLRVRHYFEQGRLVRLSDADSGATYWRLDAVDRFGQPARETLGNGVQTVSTYDAVNGRLVARTAGKGGGSSQQNFGYAWDAVGNLGSREDRNTGVREQFQYDERDRLDYAMRAGSVVLDLAYDDVGNLTYKSDVGTYRYDTARRQQALAAGANTYAYDANGAVVNASGTTISWLSYDLPGQITHPAGNYSAFSYGPDRDRYRQVAMAGGETSETLYSSGGLYERVTVSGVTRERHYIVADGRRVAVQTRQSGATPTTVYLLEDHLGGVAGFVSSSGELLARAGYGTFGARRSGDGIAGAPTSAEWQVIKSTTPRGFTDHEHLDNLGLVHMNGRVYDPVLGRFLNPDPIVQAPYDTQGFNRYAYVRNNPLRYTDPSGFCFNTHPAADQQAERCMEEILVQSYGLTEWQLSSLTNLAQSASLFAAVAEAGAVASDAVPATAVQEVTVTASRLREVPAISADASAYALMPDLFPYLQSYVTSRLLKDLLLIGGVALALLEPTPAGEALMLSSASVSSSRTLVSYYPSANGFFGPTRGLILSRGTMIDRFGGSKYSQFFSPIGTPMQARALPPATANLSLRTFEVVSPMQVEAGQVAPWFGQIGLGVQYRSEVTLGELIERQILKEIGP